MPRFWLMKSEPSVYSIDDLRRDGWTHWDGVRNYQARNFLRDEMQVGDPVLFYHSNTDPLAVVGVARVCRAAYPDHTAATEGIPVWVMVDIAFEEKFVRPVTLAQMKADPELAGLLLTRKGCRLSVQPVSEAHVRHICALGR